MTRLAAVAWVSRASETLREGAGSSLVLFLARSGSALATFGVHVYLARRLGPDEFGRYAFAVAFVSFLCLFLDFGYFAAGAKLLVDTDDRSVRRRYLGALCGIALVASGLLVALVVFGAIACARLLPAGVPPLLLAASLVAPGRLLPVVVEPLLRALGRTAMLAGWTLGSVVLLAAGVVLAEAAGRLTALAALLATAGSGLVAGVAVLLSLRPSWTGLADSIASVREEQRAFGQRLYVGRVVNLASYRTDTLLLGYFRGAADVGMYNLAMSIANFVALFGQAIAADRFRSFGRTRPIPPRILRTTTVGSVLVGVVTLVAGYVVVGGALGPAYAHVAALLPLAIVAIVFQAAYQPYNAWLLANGRGTELRRFLVVIGGVNVVANLTLIPLAGSFGAALASGIGMGGYLGLAARAYHSAVREPGATVEA